MARRISFIAVLVGVVLAVSAPTVAARTAVHLNGGGTASISQVAFNVSIGASGTASGSFECLMAGRSSFVLGAFGLSHNMIVHATPTAGSVAGSVVTFTGPGRLTLDGQQQIPIHVSVTVDVATQSFELTVVEVGAMGGELIESGTLILR